MVAKVQAPKGLKAAGSGLWREVTSKYELRSDERVVLEKACRAVDRIAVMETALDGMDLIVKGSMGQPAVNPLVSEIRAHESQVAALLRSLKLPDAPEGGKGAEEPGSRSSAARAAAQSRWGMAHGKGA